jgi:hypothetical protein
MLSAIRAEYKSTAGEFSSSESSSSLPLAALFLFYSQSLLFTRYYLSMFCVLGFTFFPIFHYSFIPFLLVFTFVLCLLSCDLLFNETQNFASLRSSCFDFCFVFSTLFKSDFRTVLMLQFLNFAMFKLFQVFKNH